METVCIQNANKQNIGLPTKLDPLGDGISSLELIRVSGSDLDIVNAARVSYGKFSESFDERDKNLLVYLLKNRHTSPFEHNQLCFRVKAPIFVVRQWMRHRMNSYNEISQRYVKSSLEFYVPSEWRYQDATDKQASSGSFKNNDLLTAYIKSIEVSCQTYEQLLTAGVAREIARGVLPTCVYTEFMFTCNMHSLMHFLDLRITAHAQYEIRQYAQGLLDLAQEYFPVSLEEWKKLRNIKPE
jgi:thymidylate synthase (FAD)